MSAMDPLVDQDKLRNALSGQSMELCNFLQNVVAITYIFGLQQPTFLLCNFLHLYFATNKQLSLKHLLDKDFKSYLPLIMQQLTFSPAYDSLWIQ